ncbi:MAG: hypothetical protein JJU45_13095 [Acidimicrobiia bacterium]|nr:hypothetical protein [Acidimicrobiia bacterium]
MLVHATKAQATAVLAAMRLVATGGGTMPMSNADRRGIAAAWHTVFGLDGDVDSDDLPSLDTGAVATALPTEGDLRLTAVRLVAVMALVDGVVEDAKLSLVGQLAEALDVHADFVEALAHLLRNDIGWAAFDEIRHNVATIPGMPWEPDHPYAPFLPYRDGNDDPPLTARYESLADRPPGSLGRAFVHHYRSNGYALPGLPDAVAEVWATAHDCLHILSGYSTSAQGELLVAAFTGGMLRRDDDLMESHILPTILIYHMGIDINKGLNAGDAERMAADPSWRDNYQGNVHLGLDPAKLWAAWGRGRAMTCDVYSGHWDFWDHVDEQVSDLRRRWEIPPLEPSLAALPDDAIVRDDYLRAGMTPPPQLGPDAIKDH